MTRDSSVSTAALVSAMALILLLSGSSVASAAPITFDFEALPLQQSTAITSTVNGLTLVVTRSDGSLIAVQDLNSPTVQVSDFGHRNLSNFLGPSNATAAQAALVLNFSSPVFGGSISFGDLGGSFLHDDDSPVVLTAFSGANGTGVNLGSTSVDYPANLGFLDQGNGAIRNATFNAAGIRSFTLSSGGVAPGTLYFDNLIVETTAPVPEPASLLLLGISLGGVLGRRRARHK